MPRRAISQFKPTLIAGSNYGQINASALSAHEFTSCVLIEGALVLAVLGSENLSASVTPDDWEVTDSLGNRWVMCRESYADNGSTQMLFCAYCRVDNGGSATVTLTQFGGGTSQYAKINLGQMTGVPGDVFWASGNADIGSGRYVRVAANGGHPDSFVVVAGSTSYSGQGTDEPVLVSDSSPFEALSLTASGGTNNSAWMLPVHGYERPIFSADYLESSASGASIATLALRRSRADHASWLSKGVKLLNPTITRRIRR